MPVPEVPEWPEKRRNALALLSEIENTIPHLQLSGDSWVLATAAAYLARCRRLMLAMDTLRETKMIDVANLPLRPLLECWWVAMWLLDEGELALDKLREDYKDATDKINRRAEMGWDPEQFPPGQRLSSWESISRWVGDRLEESGQPNARAYVDSTYNSVYRGESLFSIHGGLGAVLNHFNRSGRALEVLTVRADAGDGRGEFLWAAMLVSALALRVFESFGLDTERIGVLAINALPVPDIRFEIPPNQPPDPTP